jgi:hypothetical protein
MTPGARSVLVYGDAQAEAIALVLQSLPAVAERNRIVYVRDDGTSDVAAETAEACDRFFEQRSSKPFNPGLTIPKKAKRVRFPVLELHLLWPFCCPNPFNVPEPPEFPVGRFPCADTFIINCAEQGMPAPLIRRRYVPEEWPAVWPSLDRSFQMESARLSAQDAQSDVKIGSFILKYFRKARLFWAVNVPANRLLAEVIYRLIDAGFDETERCAREDIEAAVAGFSPRELLGGVSNPVHPLVAEHFALEWYDRDEALACPGDRELTFDQYTAELIDDIIRTRGRAAGKTPA